MKAYQNILCATDFSDYCKAAAERAAELAQHYGAQLTLLHVVEYFPEDRSNDRIAPENIAATEYREEQARNSLAALVLHLGRNDVEQEVLFTTHSARHEILRFAEKRKVDLIVVASHGHHGINTILGSTANGVIHSANCDVLTVRAT